MDAKKLVDQSIDYIMQHLEEDLSLDTVSAQFYVSKYHFSRLFKEETGESVCAFIKRCRIDQSAVDLKLNPAKAIADVGLDYGYSSSNYSTVFRARLDASPSVFKRSVSTRGMPVPFAPERVARFKTPEEYAAQTELRTLDDLHVIYERFIGSYADIEKNWYRFLARYNAYLSGETILIERFFQDPSITDPSQCICDICMTAAPDCGMNNVMRIRGGRWAVYHYDGKIEDIFETLQGIFSVWLPQSGYRMTRRYGLNIYRRIDRDGRRVAMDLYIPIS